MVRARRPICGAALACLLGAVGVLTPSSALAASGSIVRAEASHDWAEASIAGIVYRTVECVELPEDPEEPSWPEWPEPPESPYPSEPLDPVEYFSLCAWIPYATLGPASDGGCASRDRRWPNVGEGVQLVWSEGERTGVGSAHFDIPALSLKNEADAPLLCLSVIEADKEGIACAAIYPSPCPPYAIVGRHFQLDSALLEPQPEPAPEPKPDPSTTPPVTKQPPAAKKRGKRKHRQRRCHRRARRGKRAKASHRGRARHGRRCHRRYRDGKKKYGLSDARALSRAPTPLALAPWRRRG